MDSVTKRNWHPKEVFFLGAGASAVVGVPTFASFREKAEDIYKKTLLDFEYIEQFERVLKYWKTYFGECNIEEFYSAVELREMLDGNLTDKEKKDAVTTDEIESFIYSTIKKSINYGAKTDTHTSFLEKASMNSVIITTNWDILLETSRQYHIENGYISYESVQHHSTSKPFNIGLNAISDEKFRILKLHGSLNWGFCKDCGNIYYFNEKVDDRLAKGELPCDNCDGKLSRIIVPPKLSKLIKPELNKESTILKSPYYQLSAIWSKASKYLEMCERIYFIGYSFPETDVQMRTFISNAIRENKNPKEITIVSNQKHGNSRIEFEERYLSIFSRFISHSNIHFYYEGFKKFCYEIEPYYIRNPTPTEPPTNFL